MYVSSWVWSRNLKNEAACTPCGLLHYRYEVHNCKNMLTEKETLECKAREIECHIATEPDISLADFYLNKPSSVGLQPT